MARPKRVAGNAGKGRALGSKNKISADVGALINALVADRADDAKQWLDRLGQTDPAAALAALTKLASLVVAPPQAVALDVRNDAPPQPHFKIVFDDEVEGPFVESPGVFVTPPLPKQANPSNW